MTHQTRLTVNVGRRRFRTTCTCGWESPRRVTAARAHDDAQQHEEGRRA